MITKQQRYDAFAKLEVSIDWGDGVKVSEYRQIYADSQDEAAAFIAKAAEKLMAELDPKP